jgi:predicted TIM-barrel fold metal-dependent hydrolase
MQRRDFMASAAASAFWAGIAQAAAPLADIPIIDTHVHLFDSRRPQGVPYAGSPEWAKEKNGVALPSTFRALATPLNIVGAIELEASPWIEDNLWVLEQMHTDTMFVGTVGDLEPEKPDFADAFNRFRKDPLFLGIRCGNIWNRNVARQLNDPKFIDGLRRVADADLVMDSANPDVELMQAMVKINDKIPSLRIMIDHLPSFDPTPAQRGGYDAVLKEIHGRPKIYAKLSEIDHRSSPARGLSAHKAKLDQLMATFGADRVVFAPTGPTAGAPPRRPRSWTSRAPTSPPARAQRRRSISGRTRWPSTNGRSAANNQPSL